MKKVSIFKIIALFSLVALFLASCSLISLDERTDDSKLYGSLVIAPQNSRALDVGLISYAKVFVEGDGIPQAICERCDNVVAGKGSVVIPAIPIGKRRIITVKAYGNGEKELEGGIIRAMVDINPGVNTIGTINRKTSRLANVYNTLLKNGVKISEITNKEEKFIESLIPDEDDCELEEIDNDAIAGAFMDYRENGGQGSGATAPKPEDFIKPEESYLERVKITESKDSTAENPIFTATAVYSNGLEVDITEQDVWVSSNPTAVTIEKGVVTLGEVGVGEISAKFTDGDSTKTSPKAILTVKKDSEKYLYLNVSGSVNYAEGIDNNTIVAAWIWGTKLASVWRFLEAPKDGYMRVEVPSGAENIIFARGKDFIDDEKYESQWDANYPKTFWNKTKDLVIPTDGKNTCTPNEWGGKGMDNGANCTWSYVDHHEVSTGAVYATVEMEPTEDDTSLKTLKINGTAVAISSRVVYSVAYDVESASIEATPNYPGATVSISPSISQSIEPGSAATFTITVTAKDGINTQSYTVRVKRSGTAPVDLTPYKKACYREDTEDGTITFIYAPDIWGDNKSEIQSIIVKGSFTASYNERTKKWVEDTDNFMLSWDNSMNAFTLTVPIEKVKRPGYSGQPEYKIYRNGLVKDLEGKIDSKYIFGDGNKQQIIIFESDDEERRAELAANSAIASKIKQLSDFNLGSDEDLHKLANFRPVPGTTKLYRSYHPFYPTNEKTPTERRRMELVPQFATNVGIKSDINLCNDRTPREGNDIEYYDGSKDVVTIPPYYKTIISNKNVLYVGDNEDGRNGNGYIPNAKLVYNYSDSKIFAQWIAQTLDFIASHPAPFQIHCEIGVDRTGVFCAVLAGLCGASWEKIQADYVSSNNMGIGEFRDSNILKYSLENMLGVSEITTVTNLKTALENHFVKTGCVTKAQIDAAVNALTAN